MKKFVLIAIVLVLQTTVSGALLAHQSAADSSPRSRLTNLLLSFSAELGEQAELFVGFDPLPPPHAVNGGLPNEMWAVVVDRDGKPLDCPPYLSCPDRFKLKLPPSGFLKLGLSTIQPGGAGTPYTLRIAGTLDSATPDTPVVVGELTADSLGRASVIVIFNLLGENEVPPVEAPAAVGRMLIRGLVVGPDGGTRAQTIDINAPVYDAFNSFQ